MRDIQRSLMNFLAEIPADPPIYPETELIETGLLDSIGLVRLIQFLETEFGISIPDAEISPEIFSSPAAIVAYVERKTG